MNKIKKVIVTTGYMASGSSAITDLLAEYKGISNENGSFEYVFLHCPDGLLDLRWKLTECNNAIRSDEAIKSFRKAMKELYIKSSWWCGNYKKVIDSEYMTCVEKFISEIKTNDYKGEWYFHQKTNMLQDIKFYFSVIMNKITFRKFRIRTSSNYLQRMEISFIDKKKFDKIATTFVSNVVEMIDGNSGREVVLLDQLFLPHSIKNSLKFFDCDVKTIIVDRDPRDVFILNKYVYSVIGGGVPFPFDANEFCSYYNGMRKNETVYENTKVLRIHFEDLVLNYEFSLKRIEKFLDLNSDDHVSKLKIFDPARSIANIGVYKKNDLYKEEAEIIAVKLNDYLFDLSNYEIGTTSNDEMF